MQDSEFEAERENDDSRAIEPKPKMWKSCTNGFMQRKDSDLSSNMDISKISAYDDRDSIFRSSLKGFFTGRNKRSTMASQESYNLLRESESSSLVSNTDKAFSGNPLKALKHGRK
mmetsp:Transcript_21348/g.24537  ORF Transcript_21348/g.24537 Transcript_21348/m.24537 type:complete len:115 (-) Transcript_21348:268-612(-)